MSSYTPLDVRPLHMVDDIYMKRGRIWACSVPERPADDLTIWDLRCRACALHSWAAAQNGFIDTRPVGFGPVNGLVLDSDLDPDLQTINALRDLHGIEVAS